MALRRVSKTTFFRTIGSIVPVRSATVAPDMIVSVHAYNSSPSSSRWPAISGPLKRAIRILASQFVRRIFSFWPQFSFNFCTCLPLVNIISRLPAALKPRFSSNLQWSPLEPTFSTNPASLPPRWNGRAEILGATSANEAVGSAGTIRRCTGGTGSASPTSYGSGVRTASLREAASIPQASNSEAYATQIRGIASCGSQGTNANESQGNGANEPYSVGRWRAIYGCESCVRFSSHGASQERHREGIELATPLEIDGDCSGAVLRLGPERSKFAGDSQTYYRNNIWRTKVQSAGMTCPLEVVRSAGPRRRRGSSPPSALRVSTPAG